MTARTGDLLLVTFANLFVNTVLPRLTFRTLVMIMMRQQRNLHLHFGEHFLQIRSQVMDIPIAIIEFAA